MSSTFFNIQFLARRQGGFSCTTGLINKIRVNKACNFYDLVEICLGILMIFRDYFCCNYMWTAEKLKSLLNKITSPTVESEHPQISNNLEQLFVLDNSQFETVPFLTVAKLER